MVTEGTNHTINQGIMLNDVFWDIIKSCKAIMREDLKTKETFILPNNYKVLALNMTEFNCGIYPCKIDLFM